MEALFILSVATLVLGGERVGAAGMALSAGVIIFSIFGSAP
jgi:hypothetical protein